MNCQKFETVVSELARGQMMAAEQRGEALAHKNACDDCALRLRNEEILTRGLRSFAAEMAPLNAPGNVEINLLQAFRAQHQVAPIAKRQSTARFWWAAVAAMLLIAISVVAFQWTAAGNDEPQQAETREEPRKQPEVIKQQPEPQFANDVAVPENESVPETFKSHRIRPPRTRRPANTQVANHVNREIATDFIPLSYMSAANLQEGGQIIRMQVPRSALVKFGVPVNMDRYNEKVKADVLFGVDGMAHAIRFVQ